MPLQGLGKETKCYQKVKVPIKKTYDILGNIIAQSIEYDKVEITNTVVVMGGYNMSEGIFNYSAGMPYSFHLYNLAFADGLVITDQWYS